MRQATPLMNRAEIERAFRRLEATLRRGAKAEYGGYWARSGRFWYHFGEGNRVIHGFYLYAEDSYTTTLAFNIKRARPTRAFAGLFVSLPEHGICVVHSGRLWCGKKRFVN